MSGALKARLLRLERKRQERRLPRVIAHIYDVEPDRIVGFRGGGTTCEIFCNRETDETWSDLATRAFRECGTNVIAAVYRRQSDAEASDSPPATPPAPSASDSAPDDLAGIGRQATVLDLQRMGALPVAPERLV